MSTSPEDLPVSRGRTARVRAAARSASRTRTRSDAADAPVVADEVVTEPPTRSRPETAAPVVAPPTRTDGNGSSAKLPKAAKRERKEPKAAAGIVKSVEKFIGDLLDAKNFHFLSADVLRGAVLVGLVIVALQVVITVVA